jgi:hypothetical protein
MRLETETCHEWQDVQHFYSEWGRVDEGGGHFTVQPPYNHNHRLMDAPAEFRTVVTWKKRVELQYASWEEIAQPALFPDVMIARVTMEVQFLIDQPSQEAAAAIHDQLLAEARQFDTLTECKHKEKVPGIVKKFSGAVREDELKKLRRFFASGPGLALWGVCFITGYQPIIESFATPSCEDCKVQCVKRISQSPGLRCRYAVADDVAVETAIDRQQWPAKRTDENSDEDPRNLLVKPIL